MNSLRTNQILAIEKTKLNDFSSGIHYHATGTGKSWIGMYILMEFNKKYPTKNVLWICERKDILIQQFSNKTLKERNFQGILTNYNVLDFVTKKDKKWYESLNSSRFWKKPFLCIINRCFLTSSNKYNLIKNSIDLVIHDECHSIENITTKNFYSWLTDINEKKSIKNRIIGFSATPEIIYPLDNIISQFSIYDAFKEKVILPPRIVWIKNRNDNKNETHILELLRSEIEKLPYKKIIVWCGMIEECISSVKKWRPFFDDYTFSLDFNNNLLLKKYRKLLNTCSFEEFYNSKGKSILFCAVKHREGSDIPNLDGCIFMDYVTNRSERLFVQCIGRVLRKDKPNKKTYGLIIDLKASSAIQVCNRIQYFLKLKNIFPWNYNVKKTNIDKESYFINYLTMCEKKPIIINKTILDNKQFTLDEIKSYFLRDIPVNHTSHIYTKYIDRIYTELNLFIKADLFKHVKKAIDILEITKNIPHVTRGSCGSSLVCYLLGISNVDPVKYNICFERFLNKYRSSLPDIDYDFPHYLRDEVFLKIYQKWGAKIARISNHNFFHEKSALRESLRQNGIRKFISKYDIANEIKKLDKTLKKKVLKMKNDLEGTFRGFSLHCGGIIYFPYGIPEEILLDKNSLIPQVNMNKIEVSDNKIFKIDILSSRALSQLYFCNDFREINFEANTNDKKTIELLCRGDNIGLTLAETPLVRKALLLIKPKTIFELAKVLAIIRPAAKQAKSDFEIGKLFNSVIFDDDAIDLISNLLNCDLDKADKIRRDICKKGVSNVREIQYYLSKQPISKKKRILGILNDLRKYSFCKAHALSYAQLVWQLAYFKAHYPKKFWKSTIKNVQTCYKKWVHIYEASLVGVSTTKSKSIYAINKNKENKENIDNLSPLKALKKYGYWNMTDNKFFPGCYLFKSNQSNQYVFKGVIASSRLLLNCNKKKLVLLVGIKTSIYIEVVVTGNFYYDNKKVLIKGKGINQSKHTNLYSIHCDCIDNSVTFI